MKTSSSLHMVQGQWRLELGSGYRTSQAQSIKKGEREVIRKLSLIDRRNSMTGSRNCKLAVSFSPMLSQSLRNLCKLLLSFHTALFLIQITIKDLFVSKNNFQEEDLIRDPCADLPVDNMHQLRRQWLCLVARIVTSWSWESCKWSHATIRANNLVQLIGPSIHTMSGDSNAGKMTKASWQWQLSFS